MPHHYHRFTVRLSGDALDRKIVETIQAGNRKAMNASFLMLVLSGMLLERTSSPEVSEAFLRDLNARVSGGGILRCSLQGMSLPLEQAVLDAWARSGYHPDWFRSMARRALKMLLGVRSEHVEMMVVPPDEVGVSQKTVSVPEAPTKEKPEGAASPDDRVLLKSEENHQAALNVTIKTSANQPHLGHLRGMFG